MSGTAIMNVAHSRPVAPRPGKNEPRMDTNGHESYGEWCDGHRNLIRSALGKL